MTILFRQIISFFFMFILKFFLRYIGQSFDLLIFIF